MLKKFITTIILSTCASFCFAAENTPFRIGNAALPVVADVINFAYNCISMDDGSTLYDVMPNSYAKSGSMLVTVYCSLNKSKIVMPLSLQDGVISTPIAIYPVKFSGSVPASCEALTMLTVSRDTVYPHGYVLQLK